MLLLFYIPSLMSDDRGMRRQYLRTERERKREREREREKERERETE
jgi:hypothetical protein